MEDIDVIYLYEHVARELDVASAVKCIAEQHFGIRIELAHFPSGLYRAFSQFRPRIVVLSHCYSAKNFSKIFLEWRKSLFFNLSWEQLLSEATRKEKAPDDEFARNHVINHAWSNSFANFLQDHGVAKNNIFINGQPAYMLYKEPYRRYFKQRLTLANNHNLNMNRRWIFFPENFWRAFHTDKIFDMLESQWFDRERAYTMKRFARQTMEATMKWCATIANHSDIELIIRPRPATPLNEFKGAVQQIIGATPNRMHFIKEDSVREWIMASDIVISSYSTSLIEAAIAGRSAHMLEPYPIPEFLQVDWHNYITRIKTLDEFERVCTNCHTIADNSQLANWAHTEMLAHGDAIWNLADFLAKLCQGEVRHPPFPSRKIVTRPGRLRLPKWALFEYRRIRHKKVRRNMAADFLPAMHENDHLNQTEIEERTNKWKRVLSGYDYRKTERSGVPTNQ